MKNLIVTVNGVAYNVTVEEGTGAPVAAAAPAAAPALVRRLVTRRAGYISICFAQTGAPMQAKR